MPIGDRTMDGSYDSVASTLLQGLHSGACTTQRP